MFMFACHVVVSQMRNETCMGLLWATVAGSFRRRTLGVGTEFLDSVRHRHPICTSIDFEIASG